MLIELGRDYRELIATADEFITLTFQFLEGSRKRVETEIAQLEGAGELKEAQQAIAESLDRLHVLANELAGNTPEGGEA